jgi:hypothetical protein
LLRTEATYKGEKTNTAEYLNTKYKENQFINTDTSHENNQPNMNSAIKTPANVVEELNHSNENNATKKEGIKYTNERLRETLEKQWESKIMHGRYIRSIDKQLINEEDTFLWLWRGDLKAETESKLIASQDQV